MRAKEKHKMIVRIASFSLNLRFPEKLIGFLPLCLCVCVCVAFIKSWQWQFASIQLCLEAV